MMVDFFIEGILLNKEPGWIALVLLALLTIEVLGGSFYLIWAA